MSEKPDLVSPWRPITEPKQLKAMGKALEELGECSSAVARCLIQGMDAAEPVTGKVNRQWLEEEIADVYAMLSELGADFRLNPASIRLRALRKRDAQQRWKDLL